MKDINDIIDAALAKGKKPIFEMDDDEIDDWEPDERYFRRLDEAKPVAPLKPLKPGETRKDAERAANPNIDTKATAEADARAVEKTAPKNDNAVKAAEKMLKDKNIPVNDKTVKAATDATEQAKSGKMTQPTGSPSEVYAKNAAMQAAKKMMK